MGVGAQARAAGNAMTKAMQIWEALDAAWTAHDPMPTVRELVSGLGFSSTS